ncbi:MAG: flagellar basal body rod protein FlgB, partial [Bdellovibrionales bacterium]
FGKVLKKVTKTTGISNVAMEATNPAHMPAPGLGEAEAKKQKETYEVAPAGNAVIMEEQLIKAGQNVMDYNMITNLYKKNVGMIRTAIGQGQ